MLVTSISSFSHSASYPVREESIHYHMILMFNDPGKEAFLKTLWFKEKMQVTMIFSFSHNVFYSSLNKNSF